MGCSASKLDDEHTIPAGLRPFRNRLEEIRQRRRVRHVSIVSSTELLIMPEDLHDESMKKAANSMMTRSSDDMPGSPSFRFYFTDAASGDSDVDSVIAKIKDEKLAEETHTRESSRDSLTSNEDSVSSKPQKKDKGKRFKALTNAQSRVYSFLACYGPSATADADDVRRPRHPPAIKSS